VNYRVGVDPKDWGKESRLGEEGIHSRAEPASDIFAAILFLFHMTSYINATLSALYQRCWTITWAKPSKLFCRFHRSLENLEDTWKCLLDVLRTPSELVRGSWSKSIKLESPQN